MTTPHSAFRFLPILLGLFLVESPPAAAQRFGVAIGYSRMPGQLGSSRSDEGLAARVAVDVNPRSVVRLGLEGGVERLNEARWLSQSTCVLPSGGQGSCRFDSRERDTGWSLAAVLRGGPTAGALRPYLLAGLEFVTVRTRSRNSVTDGTGAHLPNFESDGSSGDDALGAPLGAGLLFRPSGLPIGLVVEGRATVLFHNYSGGWRADWNPSLLLGVRFGQ